MRDLQHQLDQIRAAQPSSTPIPSSLPIEVVAPIDSAPDQDMRVVGIAEDGTEIVYEGDAAAGKVATIDDDPIPSRREARRPITADQRPEPPDRRGARLPVVVSRAPRIATRDAAVDATPEASAEYRTAVDLVKAGRHADAIVALRGFLTRFPQHDYADNAQYWLGEAFYVQKDFRHALAEFRGVIETYPRGNKVPDALLKVGFCYGALGEHAKAKAVLEQVVTLYPKTEPAVLAAKRLESS